MVGIKQPHPVFESARGHHLARYVSPLLRQRRGHEQHLGPGQGRRARPLGKFRVVADEDGAAQSGKVEKGTALPLAEMPRLGAWRDRQFPVMGDASSRPDHLCGVENIWSRPLGIAVKHRRSGPHRQRLDGLRKGPVRGFRQPRHLVADVIAAGKEFGANHQVQPLPRDGVFQHLQAVGPAQPGPVALEHARLHGNCPE